MAMGARTAWGCDEFRRIADNSRRELLTIGGLGALGFLLPVGPRRDVQAASERGPGRRSVGRAKYLPRDLAATVYHLLGVPGETTLYDQSRRPHHLVIGNKIDGLLA